MTDDCELKMVWMMSDCLSYAKIETIFIKTAASLRNPKKKMNNELHILKQCLKLNTRKQKQIITSPALPHNNDKWLP